MSKILETRIQNKIDTEANWNNNSNFKPLSGEAIIYTEVGEDSNVVKLKVGDGIRTVEELPFVGGDAQEKLKTTPRPKLKDSYINSPYVYSGEEYNIQEHIDNFNTEGATSRGSVSGISAGTHTLVYDLLPGYCWEDTETVEQVVIKWKILSAATSIKLFYDEECYYDISENSEIKIRDSGRSSTFYAACSVPGTLSIENFETDLEVDRAYTVNYVGENATEGTVYRIWMLSGVGEAGTGLLSDVKLKFTPASSDYAECEKELKVNIYQASNTEALTWEEIQIISKTGQALNHFDIGDVVYWGYGDSNIDNYSKLQAINWDDPGTDSWTHVFVVDLKENDITFMGFCKGWYDYKTALDPVEYSEKTSATLGINDYIIYEHLKNLEDFMNDECLQYAKTKNIIVDTVQPDSSGSELVKGTAEITGIKLYIPRESELRAFSYYTSGNKYNFKTYNGQENIIYFWLRDVATLGYDGTSVHQYYWDTSRDNIDSKEIHQEAYVVPVFHV